MKRIKFLSTEIYESEGPNQGPQYRKGSVHKFHDDFADRWLRRGVAVETDEPLNEAGDPDDAPGSPAAPTSLLPLKGLNKAKLLAAADAEGVTTALDAEGKEIAVADATNSQITKAIEAQRAASPAGE